MVRSIAKTEARNRPRNANAFGELLYETSIEEDDSRSRQAPSGPRASARGPEEHEPAAAQTSVTLPVAMSYTPPTTFSFLVATISARIGWASVRCLTLDRTLAMTAR